MKIYRYSKFDIRELGGIDMIKVEDFFLSLKAVWIMIYIKVLDDHWADMLDDIFELTPESRG